MKINIKFIIDYITPVFTMTIGMVGGFFFGARQDVCLPDSTIYILFSPLFAIPILAIIIELADMKEKRKAAQQKQILDDTNRNS